MNSFQNLSNSLSRLLWNQPAAGGIRRWLVESGRIVHALGRDMGGGVIPLHARGLVYMTLLSLVPLLALSFSLLKAFGVHNVLEPTLASLAAPLGEDGADLARRIVGFVDKMQVGVLGTLGLGLLVYTVTDLLINVELAFNRVWGVKRGRPLGERLTRYTSIVIIGPVLLFSAMGAIAMLSSSSVVRSVSSLAPFDIAVRLAAPLLPFALIAAALTLVYLLLPNARVRPASALAGALVASLLWQLLGWGMANFIAGSGRYTAIYAGFAIVIIGMIWLYMSWLAVLIGAAIAFYHQNPEELTCPRRNPCPSNRTRERLFLLAMFHIGRRFQRGEPAPTLKELAGLFSVPMSVLSPLLEEAKEEGLLVETSPRHGYLPARDPATISVADLLETARSVGEAANLLAGAIPPQAEIDSLAAALDTARREHLAKLSLADLAPAEPAAEPPIPSDEPGGGT